MIRVATIFSLLLLCNGLFAQTCTINIKTPFTGSALHIYGNTSFGWAVQSSKAMTSSGSGWFSITSASKTGTEALSICTGTNWDAQTAPLGSIANLFSGHTSASEIWVTMSLTGVVAVSETNPDLIVIVAEPSVTTNVTESVNNTTVNLNGTITANNGSAITEYGFLWGTTANPTTKIVKGTSSHAGDFSSSLGSLTTGTTYYYKSFATNSLGTGYGSIESFTTTSSLDTVKMISAIVRDMPADKISFQSGALGFVKGMVQDTLGTGGRILKGSAELASKNLESWFENKDGNDTCITMLWKKTKEGLWEYNSDLYGGFFPIDNFNHANNSKATLGHNFHFTMEIHTQFEYKEGKKQLFAFSGDDDVWIFINKHLVIDLGGIHGAISDSINLDTLKSKLGLVNGTIYPLDIFFCERQTAGSNFRARTSIDITNEIKLFYTKTKTSTTESRWKILQHDLKESDSCGFNINENSYDTLPASVLFFLKGPQFNADSVLLSSGIHYGGIKIEGDSTTSVDTTKISGLKPGMYTMRYISKTKADLSGSFTFTVPMDAETKKLPTVTTASVSSITSNSASGGGEVTSDGGSSVTKRGICWSTSPLPDTSHAKSLSGSGTGTFSSSMAGLSEGKTYYVRAFAVNSVGIAYGNVLRFSTNTEVKLPTVTTLPVDSITTTVALCGGEITADGGSPVVSRGICWSTSPLPDTSNSKRTSGSGKGSFTSSVTGLSSGTTYYVRAFAVNSEGVAYGNELSFTTTMLPSARLEAVPGDTVFSSENLTVTLSTEAGCRIYYTTDGSKPDSTNATTLLNNGKNSGSVIVKGSLTINALAVGENVLPTYKTWRYTQKLPSLFIKSDQKILTSDTVAFAFDTTMNLTAVDTTGSIVTGAQIYYRIGNDSTPLTIDNSILYSQSIAIDSTTHVQVFAHHPSYSEGRGERLYVLTLQDNPITINSYCHSHKDSSLIAGKSVLNPRDTILFGTHLLLSIECEAGGVEYSFAGQSPKKYTSVEQISISMEDRDTVVLKVTSHVHGYKESSIELWAIRDTIDSIMISPQQEGFLSESVTVTAAIAGSYVNGEVYLESDGLFVPFTAPVTIENDRTFQFEARADFAIGKRVTKRFYPISRAAEAFYFDKTGDGSIDSVEIRMNRDSLTELPDSITVQSPFSSDVRTIPVLSMEKRGNCIHASFEPFTFTGSTAFSPKPLGELYGKQFSTAPFEIQDRIAPVLVRAAFTYGKIVQKEPVKRDPDTLTVIYSETVTIQKNTTPVTIYSQNDIFRTDSFKFEKLDAIESDQTTSKSVFTTIDAISVQKNDSITISLISETAGVLGEIQKNLLNRKVPLEISSKPFLLVCQAISPVNPQEYEIPHELSPVGYKLSTALIIMADFLADLSEESIYGEIAIYDALGNMVVRSGEGEHLVAELRHAPQSQLIFYWDGKNSNDRNVGSGTYRASISINSPYGERFVKHIAIGVSR